MPLRKPVYAHGDCDNVTTYETTQNTLREAPKNWFITGVAGFIGSNLLEKLLKLDQRVVGLDNFSTGKQSNLNEVRELVTEEQWQRFKFIEGDIRSITTCQKACCDVDFVLHQGALGSVPRSIADPIVSTESNINGTLNMLVAARDNAVRRFVFASSSSVYGDHPTLPKVEGIIGAPLSPYAVTKYVNELYAAQFAQHYGLQYIGLRYFNVFGPRQDPGGAYAAVIPKWISALIKGENITINGNGETSRDFCFIDNVVQANILAATTTHNAAINLTYNVALNASTTLTNLFEMIRSRLEPDYPNLRGCKPLYLDFRAGDVMHSQADISRAKLLLGYAPTHTIQNGLDAALHWYKKIT